MSLVVDDQDVLRRRHVVEYSAHVSLVTLRPAFIHTALPANLLFAFPVQLVPVVDQHSAGLTLPELVFEARRNDLKFRVVVARRSGNEHLEPTFHRQARCNQKNILRESFVLRIGDFVYHLPRNQHRHEDCLAGTCSHLAAKPSERTAIAGNLDSYALRRRGLSEPDERFDGFQLAEEKSAV